MYVHQKCRYNSEPLHECSFLPMLAAILAIDAYAPKQSPTTPSSKMRQSFTTQTIHGNTKQNLRSLLSGQNTAISRSAGKMRASEELATAPIRAIKSSRSGTARAIIAAVERLAS